MDDRIKNIIKTVKDLPEIVEMETDYLRQDAYYQEQPIPSKDWARLEVLIYGLIPNLSPLVCYITGKHKFVDDSGPNAAESGRFSFYCERCGYGMSGYMTG